MYILYDMMAGCQVGRDHRCWPPITIINYCKHNTKREKKEKKRPGSRGGEEETREWKWTTLLAPVTFKIFDARWTSQVQMLQDKPITLCLSRLDSGAYIRLQLLSTVSHSMGAHAEAFRQTDDSSSSSSNGGKDEETDMQQRPCDHLHRSGTDEVTSSATEPDLRIP